ncbi:SseB family protein [Streptomyces armeniacus]|uniref:SseB family protein n=1 Tax=Streptomyces armeniacus TaxID=83291 RepID=A0A345XKM2_9ACTN|nr:SseB family protein [Streptomyces armeniacus]AXK32188.1 SseB family protein [Streptomyces armeniacus]
MALKNIPDPGFSGDDGSADPALTGALAAWHADPADPAAEPRLLAALAGARLLVPVVAVLGEAETGPDGLRRDKTSDMAVPTLTAPDGRRALPAFSSTRTLARWQDDARPVAVRLPQALRAAAQEGADTLVVDLAGPVAYELTGAALRALAQGRTADPSGGAGAGPLDDPAVAEALRALLTAEPDVVAAHLAAGGADTDGTLALAFAPDAPVPAVARRLAGALAADEALRSRLVRGLDLAVLPPGSALPGTALYRR